MNHEIIRSWIAALRSGKYIQGQGQLRKGDAYCCLGVLCDLNENTQWTPSCHPAQKIYLPTPDDTDTILPKFISEWAGIDEDPMLIDTLIQMNDWDEYTFDQIADYLESLINPLTFQ